MTRPSLVLALATAAFTAGCASGAPPRRARPAAPPEPAQAMVVLDDAALSDADRRLEEMRARRWSPSERDAARFREALARAEHARASVAAGPCPAAAASELRDAVAEAWQLHRLFRVGEDARARR